MCKFNKIIIITFLKNIKYNNYLNLIEYSSFEIINTSFILF